MATLYDSLDSELEEEEEERILSEQHGEAAEDVPNRHNNKRKDAPDMDYSGDVQKKKIARPKVTVEKLTGMNGLIRIPDDGKAALRGTMPLDTKSAAKYTSTLMKLYTTFCFDLLPSQATADVLSQMESLGSKKELKTYLQTMRDAARNRHVEHLLGREKAEKLLNELELGLRSQQEDYVPDDDAPMGEREASGEGPMSPQPSPRPVTRTPNDDSSRIPANAITKRFGRKSIHDDSSDEEEAVFEDEPSIVSPVEKEKRALLEEHEDDDGAVDQEKSASEDPPREDAESVPPGEQHDLEESNDADMPTDDDRSTTLATEREMSDSEEQIESAPPAETEELTQAIPLAQATQDIQEREQQTQLSEAPTVVADTQSMMDFETQVSQMNDDELTS